VGGAVVLEIKTQFGFFIETNDSSFSVSLSIVISQRPSSVLGLGTQIKIASLSINLSRLAEFSNLGSRINRSEVL